MIPSRIWRSAGGFSHVGACAAEDVRCSSIDDLDVSTLTAGDDYVLTEESQLRASITSVTLPNMLVLDGAETLARIARVLLPRDRASVVFRTADGEPSICSGEALAFGEVLLNPVGDRHHHRTVGPVRWGMIIVAPATLAAACGKSADVALASPAQGRRFFRPDRRAFLRLLQVHAWVMRVAQQEQEMLAQQSVAASLEEEMLDALVACLSRATTRDSPADRGRWQTLMNRFEDSLTSTDMTGPRIPKLSACLGVSDRTLRVRCRAFLGMSPGRYILLRRLQQVRRTFLLSDAERVSVTDVAMRYGFTELGRFAGLYRQRYGESPSSTLRARRVMRDQATRLSGRYPSPQPWSASQPKPASGRGRVLFDLIG